MTRRVVVTGMSSLSPLGTTWEQARDKLRSGTSGVARKLEWNEYEGIESCLAGEVPLENSELEEGIHPRTRRSMGRVALLSSEAAERALRDADLSDHPSLTDGRAGVSFGSTEGSQKASSKFTENIIGEKTVEGIKIADYLKLMTHTCPANIAQRFGIRGRIVSTSTACTSGSQGIGYGYEAIKFGKQDVMITGGAEELVISAAAVFNIMFAASTQHEEPISTPRPFDVRRDGLVVSEGAGVMILEEREHALNRGAEVYGEVCGFATSCVAEHITIPSAEGMKPVISDALKDADLEPEQIGYVNAHATATEKGDIAESKAVEDEVGTDVPVSSLKSYMGHTLGACGALEANYSLRSSREGWLPQNLNLREVDEKCAPLNYIMDQPEKSRPEYIMSNNFAFGGVNTSLILRPEGP